MALSVTCPNCGKRFENINRKYAGKKAKCSCGELVRLGSPRTKTDSNSSPLPDDLMEVDLLGDELLGDELLGGGLLGQQMSGPPADKPSSEMQEPTDLTRSLPDSRGNRAEERRTNPTQAKQNASTARKRRKKSKNLAKAETTPTKSDPLGEPRKPAQEPIFSQSYSDLESILDGTGDAAPIVVRPTEADREEDAGDDQQSKTGTHGRRKREGSPIGFLAALLSGTLAFWFGVFALISKFKVIDQLLTSSFSSALHRTYTGGFGSVELSQTYQFLFLILGWLFWLVMVCLMILGAAQFCNSLYRLLTKRHFFRRIDGITATCGVAALFLMVGWIFAQASLQRDQHKFLNEYEKPATVNNESLEVVTLLREEVDTQHQETRNWLLAGALVPMSVFVLSMTRLLTLKPDRRNARSGSR